MSSAGNEGTRAPSRNSRLLIGVLVAASFVSYLDRHIVTVLLEPIKTDLKLTDTALGLLAGTFFASFYVLAGIPLGRLADTGDRRSLIGLCIGLWSVATACCGVAQTYLQLAAARAVVAIGEAGLTPASASLIADRVSTRSRTAVFALMSAGGALGLSAGVYAGGVLSPLVGWRTVFFLAAIPGVVLCLALVYLIREPSRPVSEPKSRPALVHTLARLWSISTYRALALLSLCATTASYAALAWMPTFLMRVHEMSAASVGSLLGASVGLGLLLGLLCCGAIADRLGARDSRWLIWISGFGLLLSLPLGLLCLFWSNGVGAVVFFGLFCFATTFCVPPTMTVVVGLVESQFRGVASSTMPLYSALGGALGPLIVGVLNDRLGQTFGQEAVRYSIALALMLVPFGVVASVVGGATIQKDYRFAEPASLTGN